MTHNHNSTVTLPALSAGCLVQNYVKCIILISNIKKKTYRGLHRNIKINVLPFLSMFPSFFMFSHNHVLLHSFFPLQNMLLTVRRYFEMLKFLPF